MIIGMDFGTTNSGMAMVQDGKVQLLPLDPTNANPNVIRTAIYINNQQKVTIGRTAVDQYFEQNIGRPVKLQQVWVGEIEVYGADMYYVTDLFVSVDVLAPGRLFLSLKSSLRDISYAGTVVSQFFYRLEDLIALYLATARQRASQMLGQDLRRVVLGRPVRFAFEPERDALAQSRLLTAAFQAGYEEVYLEYEPIAAAYGYESTLDHPQNLLVFDFGGGTLDITIARLGGGERQTLATGGVPIAGDLFDQRIARNKLPKHFGEGTIFGSKEKPMPAPAWLYDAFSDWQEMIQLQKPENIKRLNEIAETTRAPSQIQAFQKLITNNYGLRMFDQVERAKRKLSDKIGATIQLEGAGFKVFELLTRPEFENLIRKEAQQIEAHLDETIAQSGLKPAQIDAVIRTGGSAEIPLFQAMLSSKFGAEKLKAIDTFSSVTAGLGLIAHQIDAGEIEKERYTPSSDRTVPPARHQQKAPAVNMQMMLRRIEAEERPTEAVYPPHFDTDALMLLGEDDQLHVGCWRGEESALDELGWQSTKPAFTGLRMPADDQLLILTTKYRFLLITPRQLFDLKAVDATIRDQFFFLPEEQLYALANWTELKKQSRLLLATRIGQARAYPVTPISAGN